MIRIGTRGSELALWQARQVSEQLSLLGKETELCPIQSFGDKEQIQPIYAYGVTGVFTRSLDTALLSKQVDVAVHSMKDVPTQLAEGLVLAAVLPRGPHRDVWVKPAADSGENGSWQIATGSLRRKAEWLHRHPNTEFAGLRGNIQTRLQKLIDNQWDGIIMAEAALIRLKIEQSHSYEVLDWMLPAPAQGVVGVVCRKKQTDLRELLAQFNHVPTFQAAWVERQFLNQLEAGCSAPVGAYAQVAGEKLQLTGAVLSLDGKVRLSESWEGHTAQYERFGASCAEELRARGAKEMLQAIRYES
ncbi:MAG: hydroxymethylbilane synthase [Bacteroidota bacterium]